MMKIPLGMQLRYFCACTSIILMHNFMKIVEFTMQHLLILKLCKVKGFCKALLTEVHCN